MSQIIPEIPAVIAEPMRQQAIPEGPESSGRRTLRRRGSSYGCIFCCKKGVTCFITASLDIMLFF